MGKGFKHGSTGGKSGTELNFSVVGSAAEPQSPGENMIWVNTDRHITEWAFAAENPYIRTSEDLYTDVGAKTGYYLNASGEEVASTSYTNFKEITDNIILPEGVISVTVVSGSTETSTVAHGFYDGDGKLISTVMRKTGTADYDVPTGAASIRISVRNDDPGSLFATYMDAQEGVVWFKTVAESMVGFNALKQNGVVVHPISAKQYQSGAFVDVTAKSYQGGAWVDWIRYLYHEGDEYTGITGGWTSDGWTAGTETVVAVTKQNTYILLGKSTTVNSRHIMATEKRLSFTEEIKTVCVLAETVKVKDGCFNIRLTSVTSKDNPVVTILTSGTAGTTETFRLDVSGVSPGEYYVMLDCYTSSSITRQAKIYAIWLE